MANDPKVVGTGPKPSGQYLAHYKLVREIGRGGMGTVYQGYEEALQRPVAIKVLDDKFANDKEFIAKFYQEAQAAAALNHPHIVQIYFIGQQNDKVFFAMEYIDGQDVFDLLRKAGKLGVPDALEIVRQTVQGLDYAQRYGIIHRDIKPSNLMITNKGVVKIADFGLAKELVRPEGSGQMGILMGTPEYVSPELAQGEEADHRTDIYSLGATFYNLVCGHPPYQSVTAAAILQRHLQDPVPNASADNPEVSPAVSAVIAKMMAKKPHERYQNYTELLADIDEIIAQGLAMAPLPKEKGHGGPKTNRKISVHRVGHVAAGLVSAPATTTVPVQVERKSALSPLFKGVLMAGALALVILLLIVAFLLWHPRKSSNGTPVPTPPPVQNQNVIPPIPQPQNHVTPPAPVISTAVESVPLDIIRACNAELILTPAHKPSNRLEIGSPSPLSLASASVSARSTGNGDFGLPDDRKISIPSSTQYSGHFLLTPYEGPSAIVLSTAPNSSYTQVELELIPAQQQTYRALLFLHSSSGGDGRILVTLQYEGGHTQSFRLDLFDGRTLAQATSLFLPAHSAVALREKSADTFSPLGVFASDTGQKMGDAGFLVQAITDLDQAHRLQKIIFSRPIATSPPPHPGAVFPEQDKFQAAIFGINAVPAHADEWQAAKAEEDKFSAATATAAQWAALNRFSDARNLYEKMVAESPTDSYPNVRARLELDRLRMAQRNWEHQQVFEAQKANQRGEKGSMYLPDLPLRRLWEAISACRWEDAKLALDNFQKKSGNLAGLANEEKAFAADLAKITESQYSELVAARREAQSVTQSYQWMARRRAAIIHTYGRIVTVEADGSGQFQTLQAAVDSDSENFAIEVGAGRYSESVTLKGKKHMAIFGHREMPVVYDKLSVGDNCSDITIDGLIFSAGLNEVLRVGRTGATGITNISIRYCAFLGRGIYLNDCQKVTVADCMFSKRGLSVGGSVVLDARHNLFVGEAILLTPGQTALWDNIFVPQNEGWVLSDSPKPDFVSDYNFIQASSSGKFALIWEGESIKESFAHLNDWQLKTQQDKHSSTSSGSNFTDPVNGDYSLKPDSPWQGKASDRYAPGPRWAPSQWVAFQRAWQNIGTSQQKAVAAESSAQNTASPKAP